MSTEKKPQSIFGDDDGAIKKLRVEAHNVRAERGEIWINGFIDETTIELACMRLVTQIQSQRFNKINVFINSGGGSVDDGFALIDFIRTSPIPIWTVNIGCAASMGLSIYLAGDRRLTMPHSVFMAHAISTATYYNKIDEQSSYLEFIKRQQDAMIKFYAQRTKKSVKFWEKKYGEVDYWFNAEEAKELNVATDVISSSKEIDELFADVLAQEA